jgi:DNA repair protein RecO (recombination protein O)
MTEARSVEQFIGLRDDLKLLALGAYIAELTEAVSDEDSPNPELLPLCLNALYALSEKKKTPEYVKPAFELRLMAISGFEPLLHLEGENPFDSNSMEDGVLRLCPGALCAADYILSSDAKKLFSFRLSENALSELSKKTEGYLLAHLDRTFKTLDYYHKV